MKTKTQLTRWRNWLAAFVGRIRRCAFGDMRECEAELVGAWRRFQEVRDLHDDNPAKYAEEYRMADLDFYFASAAVAQRLSGKRRYRNSPNVKVSNPAPKQST